MLTPGISVKAITFRRDGFRKFENMNRKKTKNLLVLLVLSSACVAGYLVFYRHEPETRDASGGVQNMRIHSKGRAGHRSRLGGLKSALRHGEDDTGHIGMKLFPHGVDKAAYAKGEERELINERIDDAAAIDAERRLESRLKSRLEERERLNNAGEEDEDDAGDLSNVEGEEGEEEVGQDEQDEEMAGEEGEVLKENDDSLNHEENSEEEPEKDIDNENKGGEKQKDGEDMGRKIEEPESEELANADAEENKIDEEKIEKGDVDIDSLENKNDQEGSEGQESVDGKAKEEVEEEEGLDNYEEKNAEAERNAAVLNLQERLKARMDERKGAGDDRLEHAGIVDIGEEEDRPVEDRPVIDNAQDIGDAPIQEDDDPNMIMPFDERSFNREPKKQAPIVQPKPFGVEENNNRFEDFGRQEIRNPPRNWDADSAQDEQNPMDMPQNPIQMPNQLKQFGDPDRVKQHLAELNGEKEPEVYQGPGFYDKNRQKVGALDAFAPKKKLYDSNPAFNMKPKMKKSGLNVDNKNPFMGRRPGEPPGGFKKNPFLPDPKDDTFGAFRGHGNVGADGLGQLPAAKAHMQPAAPAVQEEEEDEFENRFIDKNGLLKGGAGHAPIRPIGEAGVNPFRQKGFNELGGLKRKTGLLAPDNGPKVHFDFRDKDRANANPGLLLEDDDPLVAQDQPELPPEVPQEEEHNDLVPNKFGEIPVPPPKQIGAVNHVHGEIPVNRPNEVPMAQPNEIPIQLPNKVGGNPMFGGAAVANPFNEVPVENKFGEIPVAAPISNSNNNALSGGSGHGLNTHDVRGPMDVGAECVTYTFPSADIGQGRMCLHSEGSDLVSDTIRTEKVWEPLLMRQMVAILESPENWNMGLVDIGAGIGVFTMAAALMSHPVIAVEPLPQNYLLLHQNAHTNLVGPKVTLVTNALDNSSYVGQLSPATSAEGGYSATHVTKVAPGMSVDPKNEVNVTTLDALLDIVSFEAAVVKVDVTDHRVYNVLVAGQEFLKKVAVKFILTHWRKSSSSAAHVRLMTLMAQLGYAPHRTWDGPTLEMSHLQLDQSFLIWKYMRKSAFGQS